LMIMIHDVPVHYSGIRLGVAGPELNLWPDDEVSTEVLLVEQMILIVNAPHPQPSIN
jgi:hypothetical protein